MIELVHCDSEFVAYEAGASQVFTNARLTCKTEFHLVIRLTDIVSFYF